MPSNPPDDVKPGALWLKLTEQPAPTEVVDFPRTGNNGKPIGQIRIRVLDDEQIELCRKRVLDGLARNVHTDSAEKQQGPIQREIIADATAREILCMACVSVENHGTDDEPVYAKAFPSPDQLKKLRPQEIAVLFSLYQMVQAKWGPLLLGMTKDQQNAWIARLAEGGAEFPLARLDSHQRDQLTLSLAKRVCTLSRLLNQFRSEQSAPTLASQLDALPFDTSYFGLPRSESPTSESGSESSHDLGSNEDAEVTLDMAQEAVRERLARERLGE